MIRAGRRIALAGVFMSPFYTLRLGNLYLTISDVLFLISAGLLMLTRPSNQRRRMSAATGLWVFGGTLIIIAYAASDLVASTVNANTVAVCLQYGFITFLVPFVIAELTCTTRLHAARAFVSGVTFAIGIGLFLRLAFPHIYASGVANGTFIGYMRFGSFLGANGLAKVVALSVPLTWFSLYGKRRWWIVGACFLVIGIYGVTLSASIGGLISVLVAGTLIPALMVITGRHARRRLVLVLAVVVVPAGLIIVDTTSEATWHAIVRPTGGPLAEVASRIYGDNGEFGLSEVGSFGEKAGLATEAYAFIGESPIKGMGSQQYVRRSMYSLPVHNSFLLVWAESGLLGLIGIMLWAVAPVARAWVLFRDSTSISVTRLAVMVLVVGAIWLLNSMTNTEAYSRFYVIPVIIALTQRAAPDLRV